MLFSSTFALQQITPESTSPVRVSAPRPAPAQPTPAARRPRPIVTLHKARAAHRPVMLSWLGMAR